MKPPSGTTGQTRPALCRLALVEHVRFTAGDFIKRSVWLNFIHYISPSNSQVTMRLKKADIVSKMYERMRDRVFRRNDFEL
jgi:hypothetical protein